MNTTIRAVCGLPERRRRAYAGGLDRVGGADVDRVDEVYELTTSGGLVDRGEDNDANPNENDGALHELTYEAPK